MSPDSTLRGWGALLIVGGVCALVWIAAAISPLNRTERLPLLIAPALMIIGGVALCWRASA